MSNNGWISLHRKLLEHPFYLEKRTFSKFEAWIDLLLLANHKDNEFLLGNEIIEVKRGSFITSIRKLGERWGWSNTKVNTVLELLVVQEMILLKKDTKKTVITIVKYDFYQGSEIEKTSQNRREKDTKETQQHTNNNDNKGIKKDVFIQQAELFESWWNLYANKKGRVKCESKFKQLLKKYDYETIEDGTKKYLNHLQNLKIKGEFVPQQKNPLTFLNGEHFNDEYGETKTVEVKSTFNKFDFDLGKGEGE